jgi:hypothetical protein
VKTSRWMRAMSCGRFSAGWIAAIQAGQDSTGPLAEVRRGPSLHFDRPGIML